MHIVGVPVSDNNIRSLRKQVAKSKTFTKETLSNIQDEMRKRCAKSFKKFKGLYQKFRGFWKGIIRKFQEKIE